MLFTIITKMECIVGIYNKSLNTLCFIVNCIYCDVRGELR